MYDLSVYGHLTVDRIFEGFDEVRTLGGIGNFWEACMLTNPFLFINMQPTSIGEAIIYVNKQKCTRQGRGVLNLLTKKISDTFSSSWSHLMYLNQIKDTEFIAGLQPTILSADLTSGKINNMEVFKDLDYLFISDEDLFMSLPELAKIVKGWVILHHPAGSICHNGETEFTTTTELIEDLNVLGAGDFFAASFITRMLEQNIDIEKCIEFAHQNTTKLLLRRKDE